MIGSDIQRLMNQYLASKLGKDAGEATNIAMKLVELYTHKDCASRNTGYH